MHYCRTCDGYATLGGAVFHRPRLSDRTRVAALGERSRDVHLSDVALRGNDGAESSSVRTRDRHCDATVVLRDRRLGDVPKHGAFPRPRGLSGRVDDEGLVRVLEREGQPRLGDRGGSGWPGRRDRALHPRGDEDRRDRRVRAEGANSSVGGAYDRSTERVDAHLERGALHGARRGWREHRVATAVPDRVCDDVPRLSRELAKGEVDVAAPVDRAERLENDLRVGLEDDERFVEERERGMW